jgi:hypothetical protein
MDSWPGHGQVDDLPTARLHLSMGHLFDDRCCSMIRDEVDVSGQLGFTAAATGPQLGTSGRSRLWRRTAGAAAIVAVLVVGNATQAQASTRTNSRSVVPTGSNSAEVGERPELAHDFVAGDGSELAPADFVAGDGSSALHGEFRVLNRDGSAQVRQWQSGEVNAIDTLTLSVRSADGFNGRYLLGPGVSVTGISVGDEVTIVGAGQAVPARA